MPSPSLFQRLKERKLVQWAVAYLAGAVPIAGVVELAADPWNISDPAQRTIHILLIGGFFITLVLAWYHGEKGRQRVSWPEAGLVALVLSVSVVALRAVLPEEGETLAPVALFPFESYAEEGEGIPVGDSWRGAVRDNLGQLTGQTIRSATEWDREKGFETLRRDLSAETVLKAEINFLGDGVRVAAQLLSLWDGTELWAEEFGPDPDQWDLQQRVAEGVASRLVSLGIIPEKEGVEQVSRPTRSQQAYEEYLVGLDSVGTRPDLAVGLFRRAVDLDSTFARAWAGLSRAWSQQAHYAGTIPEEYRKGAQGALEVAQRLAPDDPQIQLAAGAFLNKILRQYGLALDYIRRAREGVPNDPNIWVEEGSCLRRAGRGQESLASWIKVVDLEPTRLMNYMDVAITYLGLRQYDQALHWFDQLYEVRGSRFPPGHRLLTLRNAGWTDSLRATLVAWDSAAPLDDRLQPVPAYEWADLAMREGDYAEAIRRLLPAERWYRHLTWRPRPRSLQLALAYRLLGQEDQAQVYFDSARVILQETIATRDPNLCFQSDLGLAYAGLGRIEEARQEGELVFQQSEGDYLWHPSHVWDFAHILTVMGEYDEALDHIEDLISRPGWAYSANALRADPEWIPLRDHPRFQALLEEYSDDDSNKEP